MLFMFQPNRYISVAAATLAAGFSGAAIASAADSSSTTSATTAAATTPYGGHGGRGGGSGETALTGDTKAKVEAAALAKVPGTVVRSETDNGGVYEAHVKKADGTVVEVKVDKTFTVTSVSEARAGGGPGGRGGHGGLKADVAAVAKDLGVTEAKLQAAVDAARPDKTTADKTDRGAQSAAAIASSLGESTADVTAVIDSVRAADSDGHRGGGLKGDSTALVAALVKKFSVTTEKAQAAVDAAQKAHDAERTARQSALYAAVAKTLGKSAADVQKAFEANQPTKPATTTP